MAVHHVDPQRSSGVCFLAATSWRGCPWTLLGAEASEIAMPVASQGRICLRVDVKVFEDLSRRYSLHYLESVFRGSTPGRVVQGLAGE